MALPEHSSGAEAIVLLENSILAPQVCAVRNSCSASLIDMHCSLYGGVALLGISILLPVSKAKGILPEECIVHLAYPCDVSLQVQSRELKSSLKLPV